MPNKRALVYFVIAMGCVCVSGCGAKTLPNDLVEVDGDVTVDGEPAVGVMIELHPTGTPNGTPNDAATLANGVSDNDGHFVISTFTFGDGVKPGQYRVSCTWGAYDPIRKSFGDDRFGGKYADDAKSPIEWTLSRENADVPHHIELKTK